ncbi:MAG: cytochrome b/b6 domain-containing protein [Pseudomonadota bacterium]
MAPDERYSSGAVILHWVIAALIIGQIAGGFVMHNLPNTAAIKFDLYQLHKSFGVLVLLLTAARLGWRFTHRPPALPVHMAAWEKIGARAAHWGFYILLFLTPLSGWFMVSASPTDIPTKLFGAVPWPHLPIDPPDRAATEEMFKGRHELLAKLIIALLVLHVGAALKHQFFDKDGVFASMAPRSRRQAAGIAGAFTIFAVATAVYFAMPEKSAAPQVEQIATPGGEVGEIGLGGWLVDPAKSRLTFTAIEKGDAFTGAFSSFDAAITLDPAALNEASIEVVVSTASAATGDSLRDSNLPGAPWFDIDDYPTARFTSNAIAATGEGAYEARGVLQIKDYEQNLTLPFTLSIDGDKAHATGEVTLVRTDFGLGLGPDWLEQEEIELNVVVAFEIHAMRR